VEDLATKISDESKKLAKSADPVFGFQGAGPGMDGGRNVPVLHCRRSPLEAAFKSALQTDLTQLEHEIDHGPHPHSHDLTGWRLQGETNVKHTEVEVKNIVAVLEGEGPHADETLIIGAHYDHVGRGGPGSGSLAPGSHEIHHGADDNGSGTVALLEVARQLTSLGKKFPRRIVFISFTGEERGLLGSAHYVREPAFPLDKTIAMLNMDMVGRLADDKLIVYGTGTAKEFDGLVDRDAEPYGFHIKKEPAGFGPSDHASFYAKKIPVIHYFTGTHKDYHRPTDTAEKINISGMRRVIDLVTDMAVDLVEAEQRPTYVEVKGQAVIEKSGSRPYFGSIPDFAPDQPGYALTGVTKDGPAEKAGIRGGDIIVQFGESKIGNLDDFDSALRKFKAGDKVKVVVKRDKAEKQFEVILDPPRE
ncbi:MAG TPA: M20/M25/M40 family metallo-hydrolase, partial [Pirellulales bacterium]|nr:M20/M25/M40 family metallo-hydrolase [Pirellulales bacterium]